MAPAVVPTAVGLVACATAFHITTMLLHINGLYPVSHLPPDAEGAFALDVHPAAQAAQGTVHLGGARRWGSKSVSSAVHPAGGVVERPPAPPPLPPPLPPPPALSLGDDLVVTTEPHSEYDGDLVKWGENNVYPTADACAQDCKSMSSKGCTVWVWCAAREGCGGARKQGECWLKKQQHLDPQRPAGGRSPQQPWTSGIVVTREFRQQALDAVARKKVAEDARLASLRADPQTPLVYWDVAIGGRPVGRIVFALFMRDAPRAAENFRALSTGERGVDSKGRKLSIKGHHFYRILDRFIDQTGAESDSVFGGMFKDDEGGLRLKHDRAGLLSMANSGPNSNTSHFSIVMAPAPHLNGHYTIFGEIVEGLEVAEAVNALSRGQPDNFAGPGAGAVITGTGQLQLGMPYPGGAY